MLGPLGVSGTRTHALTHEGALASSLALAKFQAESTSFACVLN